MPTPERFDRRLFLGSGVGVAAALCTGARSGYCLTAPRDGSASVTPAVNVPALAAATAKLARLEAVVGGRVGVAAWNAADGASFGCRADERFALCSTFKWLLAAAVLHAAERGVLQLRTEIPIVAAELPPYSPVTTEHAGGKPMTIEALCEAALEFSDNGAANLLLRRLGGPQTLTAHLRAFGDRTTRLDRYETALNENAPGDPRDTTTPGAMLATMRKVLLDDALLPASRGLLITWLEKCATGLRRLRAGLPAGWTVGDKTGTGDHGAANDVALAWPPQRAPIVIASYLSESTAAGADLDAAHAEIGRITVEAFA
jgi:beta-lactamase class A